MPLAPRLRTASSGGRTIKKISRGAFFTSESRGYLLPSPGMALGVLAHTRRIVKFGRPHLHRLQMGGPAARPEAGRAGQWPGRRQIEPRGDQPQTPTAAGCLCIMRTAPIYDHAFELTAGKTPAEWGIGRHGGQSFAARMRGCAQRHSNDLHVCGGRGGGLNGMLETSDVVWSGVVRLKADKHIMGIG